MKFLVSIAVAGAVTAALIAPAVGVPGDLTDKGKGLHRECGALSGESVDGDGDTVFTFTMPDASSITTYDPGPDLLTVDGRLNADKLTPGRAAKLGIGIEPSDPEQHKIWAAMIPGLKHSDTIPVAPCFMYGMTAGQSTTNWAGFQSHDAVTGQAYIGAASSGTMPDYFTSTCSKESMTQWVGISEGNHFVQAGYVYEAATAPIHGFPFIEYFGGPWSIPVMDVNSPTIAPGQRWFFSIRYLNNSAWSFTITNLDTGQFNTVAPNQPTQNGATYIGHLGDFISERIQVNGIPTEYLAHSVARFRSAQVTLIDGTTRSMSHQAPDPVSMYSVSPGTNLLGFADTLNITDSSFSEHWNACK